ncbi:DUF4186 family protein [Methylomonas montana]
MLLPDLCLEKWHKIPQGRELSGAEQTYVCSVLERWLMGEMTNS